MIDLINSSYRCKIITIEDPVEFVQYQPEGPDLSGTETMKHATNPEAVALGQRGIRQSGG